MKNNSSHGNLFFAKVPLALHWSILEDLYFVHVRHKTKYIPKNKKAYLKIIYRHSKSEPHCPQVNVTWSWHVIFASLESNGLRNRFHKLHSDPSAPIQSQCCPTSVAFCQSQQKKASACSYVCKQKWDIYSNTYIGYAICLIFFTLFYCIILGKLN